MKLTLLLVAGLLSFSLCSAPADGSVSPPGTKSFINYFLPTPPRGDLTREAWGATNVLPRDVQNGIEGNRDPARRRQAQPNNDRPVAADALK
jgi:hypothetical protein